MPYLNINTIALPTQESDYNVWADYFELFTILHPDRKLSVEALKDRLLDENDNNAKKALKQISVASVQIKTFNTDKIADDQFDNDEDIEDEQRIKSAIIEVISYMHCRKKIADSYYPFEMNAQSAITLSADLTSKNKIYVILLVSSLIKIINRSNGHSYRITHRFEDLCEKPFGLLIPELATKTFFGAGGLSNERTEPISQLFYDKVVNLANKLHLPLGHYFTKEEAGKHNVGDGGLDWVAWLNFSDNLHMIPMYFAQCACGNDWEDKLFDANKSKWGQFIQFNNVDYQLFHFIPKSYRNPDNKWFNNLHLHSAILIDRFRLIELLEKSTNEKDVIEPYEDLLIELETLTIDF